MGKVLDEMTPREIVAALDKYVIGQSEAKKMLAIALRNRTRRSRLPEDIREEVTPKNIMMIGPTGVGKTEIARRIAKLANAPFIKVEATKYTEVGYVGRDVESMVKDLMSAAVTMVSDELAASRADELNRRVDERLVDLLLPTRNTKPRSAEEGEVTDVASSSEESTRAQFIELLHKGYFEDKLVDITVRPKGGSIGFNIFSGSQEDMNEIMNDIRGMMGGPKTRRVTIKRAREIIREEERHKFIDEDKATDIAKDRTENMGIIFIDEIDKICNNTNGDRGSVSREGVQRDILPIVEGCKVNTKWGVIDTTNILFIASGAFSFSKPSDLIPELQGRFPIRVELNSLSSDDFYRILTEPENALTKQYKALLATENVNLEFTEDGLRKIAEMAHEVNETTDNIGARRLQTVMEKLLEDYSFNADDYAGQTVVIDAKTAEEKLSSIVGSPDISRYIL